jgi:low affinity Fe/Cu permease
VGDYRPAVSIFRYLAVRHQHGNDHRHLLDGVLIQNSQNRDSAAIQVKLDELIRVSTAQNSFVGIEHLTDDELEEIRNKCERRAEAEKAGNDSVKRTGEKARKAADRAVSVE